MIKIFLAGTVQGSSTGAGANQLYRRELADLLHREFSGAVEVVNPTAWTVNVFSQPEARQTLKMLTQWDALEPLWTAQVGGALDKGRHHFWEQARLVAECGLCIAYLPGDGMSMGTAMEMALAHEAGVPVIAVTANTSNLAILSAADVVVSSLAAAVSMASERFADRATPN